MSILEALFLGILQGITEFLPVSSSGHLVLFQHLMGLKNIKDFIVFDMICHLGTLLAIFFVFKEEIKKLFFENRDLLIKILIAILPLFPLLLIMKPIKEVFEKPQYLGYFFLITAYLLFMGIRFGFTSSKPPTNKQAFIVGVFQAIAILPGVSRSGSTISIARMLGWSYEKALTFSFLLAIPTILGGVTLELGKLLFKDSTTMPAIDLSHYLVGFISSFIFGLASLLLLQKLATKQKFMYFVVYCFLLGILTIFYF